MGSEISAAGICGGGGGGGGGGRQVLRSSWYGSWANPERSTICSPCCSAWPISSPAHSLAPISEKSNHQ